MREIIFRGKNIYTENEENYGKWVYGGLSQVTGKNCLSRTWITPLDKNGYNDESVAVDENTVGQFTGLCDRNKKKIFEGDIVKYEDDSSYPSYDVFVNVGEVVYEGNAFWVSERNRVGMEDLVDFSNNTIECEVIGNIYDNPELLEDN